MARKSTRKPSARRASAKHRGSKLRWLMYLAALALLVAIVFTAWLWWDMREWRPSEALYPEQGALVSANPDRVRFETIRALGGAFVYLELREASQEPNPAFAERLADASAAGLQVGIVLPFDPCQRADPQSTRFTRMVPRDSELLPPAIALGVVADNCPEPVSDAAVSSELLTLINQIEMHAGKPLILKLSPEFEARYRVARKVERDLWLERDRSRPAYAGRPWLLWSANRQLVSAASEEPIEWVVVQR